MSIDHRKKFKIKDKCLVQHNKDTNTVVISDLNSPLDAVEISMHAAETLVKWIQENES